MSSSVPSNLRAVGLGLVEQQPAEAGFPQVQGLAQQSALAHSAQAGDHRHRRDLCAAAGAEETGTQARQLPGAPHEVLVAGARELGNGVQAAADLGLGRGAAAQLPDGEAAVRLAVEQGSGVIRPREAHPVWARLEQPVAGHRQGRRRLLGLGVGQQVAVEGHRQLAGVAIAHREAHRHHRRHPGGQQGGSGAAEAGRLAAGGIVRADRGLGVSGPCRGGRLLSVRAPRPAPPPGTSSSR